MNEKGNNKASQPVNDPSFGKVVDIFIDNIESLATSLPIVVRTIALTNHRAIKLHQEFLNKDCEKETDEKGDYYVIKPEHITRNKFLRKEIVKSNIAYKLVQRNFIVSLISQFDSFIGSLIRAMFYLRPELLNNSDKQLTFSHLIQFSDMASAREYIIEKEIESVLRENHTYHFKWLEEKVNVPLRKDLPIWSTFIELTERRNLYVHNDGIISNQYIKICKENNVVFSTEPKIGDTLDIGSDYFEKAFQCIFELGVKLSQVLWRKLLPTDVENADISILNISYELLTNNQFDLAREILDFSDKYIKKFSSEDLKLRLVINRAQVYKWSGKQDKCQEIVKSIDWSACSEIFKLASQVLLDDYENAIQTMKLLGKSNGQIQKSDYKEWPLFNEFRKQKIFESALEEIFPEKLDSKERFASSGFKIIEPNVFFEILDERLAESQTKVNGFLSSKFFVEKHLAKRGFDIGSCWEFYKQCEQDGIIETYKHTDPLGKYPPISAVRRKLQSLQKDSQELITSSPPTSSPTT